MASLDQILKSITDDKNSISGNSLVIPNHIAQCKLFGIRQGVEIFPEQDDDYGTRKRFVSSLWEKNKLDIFQDSLWEHVLCDGEVLLYLRPNNQSSYNINFYSKQEFKAFYDELGDLVKVFIVYPYEEATSVSISMNTKKWVKLAITSKNIIVSKHENKPSFHQENLTPVDSQTYENTLNFIPCVVIKNKPFKPGSPGRGEFDWLKTQIETHENNIASISSNLEFFGAPSLVSTRSPSELTEAIEFGSENLNKNRTLSSAGGWYSVGFQNSTSNSDPFNYRMGNGSGVRIKRIVGNVAPEERFGYIAPDPVSPDHIRHVQEEREALHFALGGIDERGISANATAYELKSIYGKIAATAISKCKAIYEHGFCKLFEMALAAEEDNFRKSIAYRLKKEPGEITDQFIGNLIEKNKLPDGLIGIPPIGSRRCKWRWKGPVFERSPRDIQLTSIVARNLQELGVRSLEALKVLFEDKTDKELEEMLSGGYPFRYMSSVGASTGQLIGLYQQMLSVPNQQNPNLPMAASIPMQPLINKSIETLYQEINYQPNYEPTEPGDIPEYNTGYKQYYDATTNGAGYGGDGSPVPTGTPGASNSVSSPGSTSAYNPSPNQAAGIEGRRITQQPMGSSVQFPTVPPEFTAAIPQPGSTITKNPPSAVQPEQSVLSSSVPPGAPIPPDLAVSAAQPGSVWQQLFPNFSKLFQRKPKSSKRSK